jgi:hypothetical protein
MRDPSYQPPAPHKGKKKKKIPPARAAMLKQFFKQGPPK